MLGLGLGASCASAQAPPAQAPVYLSVQQYLDVNIVDDTIDLGTVPAHVIGSGSFHVMAKASHVEIRTNVDATLVVPYNVTLARVGGGGLEYSPDVDVTIETAVGDLTFKPTPNRWELRVGPGLYLGQVIRLHVRINRTWSVADLAGTSSGPLTVTLVPGH
jgi:hypothetical protein